MKRRYVDVILMILSVFFFLMLSVSYLLMPIESKISVGNLSIYSFVAGLMHWIAIIMGITVQSILAYRRRVWCVKHDVQNYKSIKGIGAFTFFKNIYGVIADVMTVASLAGVVLSLILTTGTGYSCYILISVFVFSFCMHCVLNGKIFQYITNYEKSLEISEGK